ncbi:HNH endonuclease [Streptomyces sp. NPDC004435]|uniref:HNH endonuclease n=1 Tax=Streptomyces sp. NPDC004435 TaxID=3364701 RepID=UPI0036CD883C
MARRRTGPTDEVKDLVHQRDGGRCVRCERAYGLTIHHRVNRGMGGAREGWVNEPQNLLLVCTLCNGWFEDHPQQAYDAGWKVRRPQRPQDVEVLYGGGGVYRLAADGARSLVRVAGR